MMCTTAFYDFFLSFFFHSVDLKRMALKVCGISQKLDKKYSSLGIIITLRTINTNRQTDRHTHAHTHRVCTEVIQPFNMSSDEKVLGQKFKQFSSLYIYLSFFSSLVSFFHSHLKYICIYGGGVLCITVTVREISVLGSNPRKSCLDFTLC